jgi:ATP-dependent Zn protease
MLSDPAPPTITGLSADPDPQHSGGFVNISTKVSDDVGLDEVRVSIAGVGNYSMNYDSGSDRYFYNASFSDHGNYSYAIWARDTSDNWNSESSSFTILEPQDEKPVDDWWWIILVIIIIILVIIILFVLMRRKKKEEVEEAALPLPPPPPPPTP